MGNIADFSTLQDMSKWIIGNTSATAANKLKWHKIQDGNKTLLICDRVILVKVSWTDLNGQSLIAGKTITIDGQQYKCRALTGGNNYRSGSDHYSGGITPNEWDNYVVNELGMSSAPIPASSDLDSTLNNTDKNSVHNQAWNWMGIYSWCQEIYASDGTYRALRGYNSARNWSYSNADNRGGSVGWRPALEILNSAPLISGVDENIGNKNAPFSYAYQVSDADGDNITVTEKNNGQVIRSVSNAPQNTDLTLIITQEKWSALAINTEHTITIEVGDGKGGTSTRTIKFTKVNAPPLITGTDTFLGDKNLPFTYVYQVSDSDGDPVKVIEKLNGTALRTLTNATQDTDLTVTIDRDTLYGLPLNSTNTISIEASDDKGNAAYRNVTFKRVNAAAVIVTDAQADLGTMTTPPAITYQVSDPEGDSITVLETLDGTTIRTIDSAQPATIYTVAIPWLTWITLSLGQHTIKVRATDQLGAYSERVVTFVRSEDRIQVSLKSPIETAIALVKVVPVLNTIVPAGYQVKVEVANNAYDDEPTWEDATTEALQMQAYSFTNTEKTAGKWGFSMRASITPEVI